MGKHIRMYKSNSWDFSWPKRFSFRAISELTEVKISGQLPLFNQHFQIDEGARL